MSLRVIICGGRTYTERAYMAEVIYKHCEIRRRNDVILIHGGARGADAQCNDLGSAWGLQAPEVHRADWDRYGPGAGPIRNQEMVDAGADLLIAFPGGRGTEDCVRRAEVAGIRVVRA